MSFILIIVDVVVLLPFLFQTSALIVVVVSQV
jgi:hypothetical protein